MMWVQYRGKSHTINELSEMSGIAPATIRDRLRRGYSVEEAVKMSAIADSVQEFVHASHWEDWIGMSTSDLYQIYWRWCVSHEYTPLEHKGFSRHIFQMHPMLKVVPTKLRDGYKRVIRLRG